MMKEFNQATSLLQKLVRLRGADSLGYVQCVTCSKRVHFTEADGAHYIARGYKIHALDPMQVWPCCQVCNRHLSGNMEAYREFMLHEVGPDYVEYLESTKHQLKKYTRHELLEIISDLKSRIKVEEERLGLR